MKTTASFRTLCAVLIAALLFTFAGCQKNEPAGSPAESAASGVDICEKLASLMASDKDLGIAGKYQKIGDITDGSIDNDLVGTWVSADGDYSYTYSDDGVVSVKSDLTGDSELPYTCIKVNGLNILCEEFELDPEFYEGAQEGDTQLSYTAYSVEDDVMYQVVVEEYDEDFTSSMSALTAFYRADENGSAAQAVANNPYDIASINGTWESEKGSVTIKDGVLTFGEDSFEISFNEQNKLVAEKDGVKTVYGFAVSIMKEYDYDDRSRFTEKTAFALSYTGADESDKPNLLPVMTDYKTEYEYDSWYYSASFELAE